MPLPAHAANLGVAPYTVTLASVGNPDFDQDCTRPLPGVGNATVVVESISEAAAECRKFIDENELGAGNWAGGLVMDSRGQAIAEVSYNGRIWLGGYTPGNEHLFNGCPRSDEYVAAAARALSA